jgi:hypothetical protein
MPERCLGARTITFDSPSDARVREKRHGPASHVLTIPAGLPFLVALTQEINTATAAAGDPIQAKLITPIKDGSKTLVPRGAAIAARIVRIRQLYGSSVFLDVKLEIVDVKGVSIRLTAAPSCCAASLQRKRRAPIQCAASVLKAVTLRCGAVPHASFTTGLLHSRTGSIR